MANDEIINFKPSTYEEKYEGDLEESTAWANRLNDLKKEIKVMLPCKVTKVNHNTNYVTVELLDYDSDEIGNVQPYAPLTNVPIRQPMDSSSAFIRLPVQVGDIGTIEFFDSSVDDLVTSGTHTYDYTEDWHKLSDNLFTNGFLPNNKTFTFDSGSKIILGGKDGTATFKLTSDNNWVMVGNLQVNGNITATGTITGQTDVIAGTISGKIHTHPYTDNGTTMNTSAPN